MGRRALKRIDPKLDLSWHLVAMDDLPFPLVSERLFTRAAPLAAPLEVEIGSGKGLFLVNAAAERPHHDFLGVEISRKYARHAAARLARAARENARVIAGDAQRLLRELTPDDSLEAVHVYFPDPWWKKRHHKRRVLNERFLDDVARTLRAGGRLHFWTDVREYFDATLELIARRPPLEGPIPVDPRPAAHTLDYRTHFERRTRLAERPVYRSEFIKPG